MRILGELIVFLGLAAIVLILIMLKVVAPVFRRRHLEQLERENERLDRLIGSERTRERRPR